MVLSDGNIFTSQKTFWWSKLSIGVFKYVIVFKRAELTYCRMKENSLISCIFVNATSKLEVQMLVCFGVILFSWCGGFFGLVLGGGVSWVLGIFFPTLLKKFLKTYNHPQSVS